MKNKPNPKAIKKTHINYTRLKLSHKNISKNTEKAKSPKIKKKILKKSLGISPNTKKVQKKCTKNHKRWSWIECEKLLLFIAYNSPYIVRSIKNSKIKLRNFSNLFIQFLANNSTHKTSSIRTRLSQILPTAIQFEAYECSQKSSTPNISTTSQGFLNNSSNNIGIGFKTVNDLSSAGSGFDKLIEQNSKSESKCSLPPIKKTSTKQFNNIEDEIDNISSVVYSENLNQDIEEQAAQSILHENKHREICNKVYAKKARQVQSQRQRFLQNMALKILKLPESVLTHPVYENWNSEEEQRLVKPNENEEKFLIRDLIDIFGEEFYLCHNYAQTDRHMKEKQPEFIKPESVSNIQIFMLFKEIYRMQVLKSENLEIASNCIRKVSQFFTKLKKGPVDEKQNFLETEKQMLVLFKVITETSYNNYYKILKLMRKVSNTSLVKDYYFKIKKQIENIDQSASKCKIDLLENSNTDNLTNINFSEQNLCQKRIMADDDTVDQNKDKSNLSGLEPKENFDYGDNDNKGKNEVVVNISSKSVVMKNQNCSQSAYKEFNDVFRNNNTFLIDSIRSINLQSQIYDKDCSIARPDYDFANDSCFDRSINAEKASHRYNFGFEN